MLQILNTMYIILYIRYSRTEPFNILDLSRATRDNRLLYPSDWWYNQEFTLQSLNLLKGFESQCDR